MKMIQLLAHRELELGVEVLRVYLIGRWDRLDGRLAVDQRGTFIA